MVEVVLLGLAQDAGVPQAGCNCSRCAAARGNPSLRARVVSLGVIDRKAKKYWIVDATPDFRDQFGFLLDFAPDCHLGGILITHLHMGHYTGLIHLGQEAANLKEVPLYCTEKVGVFLEQNAPWSGLVDGGNLKLIEVHPDVEFLLSEHLRIQPIEVSHRAVAGETLAFGIQGETRRLFFCPDIDSWADWGQDIRAFISEFDIALLDGSFYSDGEVPGRDMGEIPHPTVSETMDILEGLDREIVFIHLNHTNPLLDSEKIRGLAAMRGFQVGFEGQSWDLTSPEPGLLSQR